MDQTPNTSAAVMREVLGAISKGTRKMKADAFFHGLEEQLLEYKKSRYDELVNWLRKAGIKSTPSPEQCADAARLARKRKGAHLHPHATRVEKDY
jgi:hypothetical protein